MRKKRILLIEDELNFSKLLKYYLEHVGDFEVRAESSGDAAIEAAHKFRPDIALIDLVLPDSDGRTVARELLAVEDFRNLPVLFVSGVHRAEQVEFDDEPRDGVAFLAKPISPRKLMNCITSLLGSSEDDDLSLSLTL